MEQQDITRRIKELESSRLNPSGYAQLGKLYMMLADALAGSVHPLRLDVVRRKGLSAYKDALNRDPDVFIDVAPLPDGYREAIEAYRALRSDDKEAQKTRLMPALR